MLKKWKAFLLSLTMITALVSLTGCGKGSSSNISIPGVDGPHVSLLQDNILVSMTFQNIQLDGGLRYNIPKYTYSYLEISPDATSGGTLMTISISLQDIFGGGLEKLDPQRLPGGRNLPGVNGGSLPAVAFSIEKFHNMAFYLGKDVFGIFLPSNVGVDGSIASFRYYVNNKAGGTVSLVGKDQNGENAGILLMLDLTKSTKMQLKNIYNQYNSFNY
jgi:hypothetical protein